MKNITTPSCCSVDGHGHDHGKKFDVILYGSLAAIIIPILLHLAGMHIAFMDAYAMSALMMLKQMWWGIAAGMFFVGLMNKIPREYFRVLMGSGDSAGGIFRAVIAGVLLDLCSHGILLVAAKLYERGASLAQIMAFLIASPWNSVSLTLILISLVGLKWTLVYILGSCLVALLTGFAYIGLVRGGALPENPDKTEIPEGFSVTADARARLRNFRLTPRFFTEIITDGVSEGKMLVRWLFLGIVIAAAVQTFIPEHMFHEWLGPSLVGLVVTLIAATIIEVCSEGSVPIASVIFHKAAAPGNAFAFLMAGVSTDYTEMLILRQMTGSWKIALSMPFVTVPQILLLGYIMNHF